MVDGPYLKRTVDADGDHRASSLGANHEPLMAITEGIKDSRDVEHALLLTLDALLNAKNAEQYKKAIDDLTAAFGSYQQKIDGLKGVQNALAAQVESGEELKPEGEKDLGEAGDILTGLLGRRLIINVCINQCNRLFWQQ